MAFDKIVDGAALNRQLSSLADRIRAKGETTARLCFEAGDFPKAVDAIQIGSFPMLHVTAPADSEITVTDGRSTFTGTGTGEPVVFKLPNMGTWTVKAVRGSDTAQETVIVSEVKDYTVSLVFGIKISTLPVGGLVKMKVNGAVWEWIIVHQGKPSSLYDESCNGTWLLMKDIYENREWHSINNNDYENSTIDEYLNGTFFGLLDANIRGVVKQVRVPYRPGAGYNSTPINSGESGLLTRVFLLSSYEVGYTAGNTRNYAPQDGARLTYFNDGSGSDPKRVAHLNGSDTSWWLRSPGCNSNSGSGYAFGVNSDGFWGNNYCSYLRGVRPALILPSGGIVDKQHNVLN